MRYSWFQLTEGKAVSKCSIAQYTIFPFNFRFCMWETSGYGASIVAWSVLLPYCASVHVSFIFVNVSSRRSTTLSKDFARALERAIPL